MFSLQGPNEHFSSNLLRIGFFVFSAALAAALVQTAWSFPIPAAAALVTAGTLLLWQAIGRKRARRLLRSGDVGSVLKRWSTGLAKIPHRETMGPIMTATAFAAYGWVENARAALASAERGPAWDAAIEHRLFVDALLLTFEGDRDEALIRASRLARLPLPPLGTIVQKRVATLRLSVGALARAFAHQSQPGDRELLERASHASPLVFWAMRYAAAIVAIDDGDFEKVRALIDRAPTWPAQSAFRAFHDEIKDRARRRS